MNLRPVGPTSSTSTSSGNVWLMFFRVTVTLVTGLVSPATVMFEGYGLAGAPVVAPVPLPGMVIEVLFEKVLVFEVTVPSRKVYVSVPRSAAPSWKWMDAVMLLPQVPLATKVKG